MPLRRRRRSGAARPPAYCYALLGFGVAACGHPSSTEHPGEPYVTGVEVHGNQAIDDDTLIGGLTTQRAAEHGLALDPYELDQDSERLRGLYQRRGYFEVAVHPEARHAGNATTVVFTIREGVRARLARIEVLGLPEDPALTPSGLRARVASGDGEPFDYDTYDAAKATLLLAVQDAGYAHASLDATVIADRQRHEAVVRLVFVPGARCTFGEVTMVGVTGELAEAARARSAVRTGERYAATALRTTQAALYELGRFAIVRVEPALDRDDAVVPVRITVSPASRHELRFGGGLGLDQLTWQVRGRAGYTQAGVLDPLTTLDLELRPAVTVPQVSFVPDLGKPEPRVEGEVSLHRLDLFRPRLTGELAVTAQYLALEAYTVYGPRLRAGLSTLLRGHQLQLAAGAQLWVLGFSAPSAALDAATISQLGLDRDEQVVALDQSAVLDLRDNLLDPTHGGYAALHLVEGIPGVVGSGRFLQATPEVRGYLSLAGFVVSVRAKVGVIAGDVPVTERFYGGGAASDRGFAERQLSPHATALVNGSVDSVVIGGAGEIETSLELRHPIGHWRGLPWIGAVFLDAGNVTGTAAELSPASLYWAAGAGVRVTVGPVPVRVDLGYRLNRTGPGDPLAAPAVLDRLEYHLGIGEAF
jgi:outer membrane protein assembly factor BamA